MKLLPRRVFHCDRGYRASLCAVYSPQITKVTYIHADTMDQSFIQLESALSNGTGSHDSNEACACVHNDIKSYTRGGILTLPA